VQWGLIQRIALPGERRDYYQAEKDPRKIASIIVRERKKRELEPLLAFLNSVAPLEEVNENEDARHLNKLTREMRSLVHLADAAMEKYIKADASWLEKLLTFAVS
jgi:DNA-binding transcriptional regulator GbsR (MarR family)